MLVSLVILRDRYIGVLVGQIRGQGLHILVHGLSHSLAVCHGLDHRTRALDGVAAGEDAGDAGAADLIRFKQAAGVGFQILGAVGDRRTVASYSLAVMCRDSEKHSICRVPWRMAVRATSMAALPAPITMARSPRW